MKLFVWIAALALLPTAAAAEPITAVLTLFQGLAATKFGAFVLKIGLSLVTSALAAALAGRPDQPASAGIKTDSTTTGGNNPESFILGRYATSGNMAAPPYSHPNDGGAPNEYLTYVIDVSGVAGVTFERIIVAGEYITDLQASAGDHDQEGMLASVSGVGHNIPHLFLTWHDGSQVAADAYMMANYASYPERPWSADMVGAGLTYAVVTFRYNREIFNSLPGVRFEVMGIPLYDPRKDSSVGGSGSHRWDNKATWEQTENPVVMVYNILRGITISGGRVWGGRVDAADLPLSNWFAAMNECDTPVTLDAGGTEPQYRAGYEVAVDESPAAVIEELLKACSAEIAEFGGVYKVRVGPPALPVYFFTDDDVVTDRPQTLTPYPGLDGVHNAIHASHPAPDALWETRDAPPRYNSTWEEEDGDRQLVAQVDLPAVASDTQVQRLMKAWIEDERRFRRHSLTLPPDAAILEPLDTVGWTSARNGYSVKVFEIGEVSDELHSLLQGVAMRERDQSDFVWSPSDEIAVSHPSPVYVVPVARSIDGWTVTASSVLDPAGVSRRPALLLEWDETKVTDAAALEYEVRPDGRTELVAKGSTTDVAAGELVLSEGILPGVALEVRGRLLTNRPRAWTAWTDITTLSIKLGGDDIDTDTATSPVPADLALTTELIGDGAARVAATWSAASGAVEYQLGITETGGNEVTLPVGGLRYEWDCLPGIGFSIRVRSINTFGAPSAWSSAEVITSATDSTPPAVPTGLAATPGFNAIWLKWDGVADADLAFYQVRMRLNSTPPTNQVATFDFQLAGNQLTISGLPDAAQRWLYVRAVDTSGNLSDWSTGVTVTTSDPALTEVTTEDITGIIDETSFATNIKPIEVVGSLPGAPHVQGRMVFLTTDSKLYRNDGSGWTVATDGADIVANSITAGQMAAGAIGTDQLAAGAATISKLNVVDFNNLAPDGTFIEGIEEVWENRSGSTVTRQTRGSQGYTASDNSPQAAYLFFPSGTAQNEQVRAYVEIPVDDDDQFWISFMSATGGSGTSPDIRVSAFFSDATGVYLGSRQAEIGSGGTTWSRKTVAFDDVPAGATRLYALFVTSLTGAGRAAFVTDLRVLRKNAAQLILDGSLTSNMVGTNELITQTANIKDAIITDAKIANLSAAKLTAGTALAGSITVSGTALSTVESRAADPAARVNAAATKIDPGKVVISGATTLEDWRGSDTTTIDGGKIETNTIEAQALKVGSNVNLIQNSNFAQGLLNWDHGTSGTIGTGSTLQLREGVTYSGADFPVLELKATADNASTGFARAIAVPMNGDETLRTGYQVEGDAYYEFSAKLSSHVSYFRLRVAWYNAAGGYMNHTTYVEDTTTGQGSSTDPEAWPRIGVILQAPTLARYGRPMFEIYQTTSTSDAFLMIYKPVFGESKAGAAFMPYSLAGQTIIEGGNIKTKSLQAEQITLDEVTLSSDGSGNLIIKSAGVDTTQMASNAVTRWGATALASDVAISSDATWQQVLSSGTVSFAGGATLHCFGKIGIAFEFTTGGGRFDWLYRIKRNGTVIHQSPRMTAHSSGGTYVGVIQGDLAPLDYVGSTVAGSYACTVEVYIDNAPLGGSNGIGNGYIDVDVKTGSTFGVAEVKR